MNASFSTGIYFEWIGYLFMYLHYVLYDDLNWLYILRSHPFSADCIIVTCDGIRNAKIYRTRWLLQLCFRLHMPSLKKEVPVIIWVDVHRAFWAFFKGHFNLILFIRVSNCFSVCYNEAYLFLNAWRWAVYGWLETKALFWNFSSSESNIPFMHG